MNIHLIDDDEELHDLLKTYFEDMQMFLTASETPEKGIDYVKNNNPDLVIIQI